MRHSFHRKLMVLLLSSLAAACGGKASSTNPLKVAQDCPTYCAQVNSNCKAPNTSDIDISTSCLTTCARFPTTGKESDASGDTLQCRLYHSGTPAESDPVTHCPHAGVSGANTCGAWCDVYCREALNNCTGAKAIYTAQSDCQAACKGIATSGKVGDTSGDTIQCRIYHLNVAGTSDDNATLHCPHGKVPSDACK